MPATALRRMQTLLQCWDAAILSWSRTGQKIAWPSPQWNLSAKDALQGARGSLHFQLAWKDHPRSTSGELSITGEEFKPVIGVIAFLREILCFDLEGFFVQRLLARNHPWLLKRSQKHGKKNLWLSCPLLWLLGPKIVKQTLDRVAARPWALCSMDFSKPFWFREHREGRPRMDSRFLYHMCVGYSYVGGIDRKSWYGETHCNIRVNVYILISQWSQIYKDRPMTSEQIQGKSWLLCVQKKKLVCISCWA